MDDAENICMYHQEFRKINLVNMLSQGITVVKQTQDMFFHINYITAYIQYLFTIEHKTSHFSESLYQNGPVFLSDKVQGSMNHGPW